MAAFKAAIQGQHVFRYQAWLWMGRVKPGHDVEVATVPSGPEAR